MRRKRNRRKSPTDLGLTVHVMRRKLWLIRIITRHNHKTLVRPKLWKRVGDGLLPRAKDFWAMCDELRLEPEDFVLSERFLVEKLREYRRQHVASTGTERRVPVVGQED